MSEKKKILHLITGLEIGGAEMMLLKTLPKMQNDFDNRVCCIRGHGPIGLKLENDGVPVYYLNLKNIFDLSVIFRFKKVIREFEPDILVTYLIHADLFGRIFGRIFGMRKIVCSVRVKLVQWKYLPLLILDGLTSFFVDHYHFNSQTVANMYLKYFFLAKEKVTVIPNGLEIEKYQVSIDRIAKCKELEIPIDVSIIGCVGRLEKQKGQKYLLEAFALFLEENERVFLILIGDGSDKEQLEVLSRKLKIENSTKFLGNRSDIPEILHVINIFILPSLYEGMSNALMEAMATGLSIIATDIPENKELLGSEENGIFVPPYNVFALAKKMSFILRNKTYAKKIGVSAKKEAMKRFSLDTIIYNFVSLFKKL